MTADGGRKLPEDEIAVLADRVVGARMNRPDGPVAPLDLPGQESSR